MGDYWFCEGCNQLHSGMIPVACPKEWFDEANELLKDHTFEEVKQILKERHEEDKKEEV